MSHHGETERKAKVTKLVALNCSTYVIKGSTDQIKATSEGGDAFQW